MYICQAQRTIGSAGAPATAGQQLLEMLGAEVTESSEGQPLRSFDRILREISRPLDVLLIHPPAMQACWPDAKPAFVRDYFMLLERMGTSFGDRGNEPPVGLLMLTSLLRARGYRVDLIDFNLLDLHLREKHGRILEMKDIEDCLSDIDARVVGISAMTTQEPWVFPIATRLKERFPQLTIVVGGTHFSFLARPTLQQCPAIDVVAIGEGEATMLEIAEKYCGQNKRAPVAGTVYRSHTGQIETAARRSLLTSAELEALPAPAYDLLPAESQPMVRLYLARGCSGHCSFCAPNLIFGQQVRSISPGRFVDQLSSLHSTLGFDVFVFGDLTYTALPSYRDVCEEIIERGLPVKFWVQTRVDEATKIDFDLLRRAGCIQVALGLESAEQTLLDHVRKDCRVADGQVACERIKRAGLQVQGYFMLGLPFETNHTCEATVQAIGTYLDQGLVDLTHIALAVPYPGTEFWIAPERYGYKIVSEDFGERYWMGTHILDTCLPALRTVELSDADIYDWWKAALGEATRAYVGRLSRVEPSLAQTLPPARSDHLSSREWAAGGSEDS